MSKQDNKIKKSFYEGNNSYFPENHFTLDYKDNSDEFRSAYREELLRSRGKSQDDFEKYLNIFGSGGLIISLTLLSKLIETDLKYEYQYMIMTASILFLLSLFSNLFSHYIAIFNEEKNIEDVDNYNPNLNENIDKRNKCITILNWISLGSISIGAILISVFLIINLNKMSEKKDLPQGKPTQTPTEPRPLHDQKGRTTSKPSFQIKPKK